MGKKLFVALILFFILSQFIIFGVDREPWFDVSFSLETANKLYSGEHIDFRQHDVHPPTYYVVLSWWYYLNPGMSEYHWAQEMSVLFILLFLVFAYFSLRKLFGEPGEYAVILLSLCTAYLHQGTEARMYAMVLFLSSVILYSVLEGLTGPWSVVGVLGAFVAPMVHYYSGVLIIVFFSMYLLILGFRKQVNWKKIILFIVMGLLGTSLALSYAIPQRSRVQGTWFEPPAVSSWPDALIYVFFMNENVDKSLLLPILVTYVLFLGLMGFIYWDVFNRVSNIKSEGDLFIIIGALGGLFPLLGLAGAPLLGGNGFHNLYHHRFFIGVTWIFGAICFVYLIQRAKFAFNVFYAGMVVFLLFFVGVYSVSAHHELQNLIDKTPCKPAVILHESPFSSLQYMYWERKWNCGWVNYVSTSRTPRMLNGGGGDVMPEGRILYNLTLPDGVDYYYVYGAGTVPVDGEVEVVAKDDGVELWYITRAVHKEGAQIVGTYFDNSTNYTRYEWNE